MVKCKLESKIMNRGFHIFAQIILTFVFLVFFFFIYTIQAENQASTVQMDYIVDDIVDDMAPYLGDIVQAQPADLTSIILNTSLEKARQSVNRGEHKEILKSNADIRKKTYAVLGICVVLSILVILGLYLSGYCLPFHVHIKSALILVSIVAVVEIAFLEIITVNYWAFDINKVKQTIGKSINGWIKKTIKK